VITFVLAPLATYYVFYSKRPWQRVQQVLLFFFSISVLWAPLRLTERAFAVDVVDCLVGPTLVIWITFWFWWRDDFHRILDYSFFAEEVTTDDSDTIAYTKLRYAEQKHANELLEGALVPPIFWGSRLYLEFINNEYENEYLVIFCKEKNQKTWVLPFIGVWITIAIGLNVLPVAGKYETWFALRIGMIFFIACFPVLHIMTWNAKARRDGRAGVRLEAAYLMVTILLATYAFICNTWRLARYVGDDPLWLMEQVQDGPFNKGPEGASDSVSLMTLVVLLYGLHHMSSLRTKTTWIALLLVCGLYGGLSLPDGYSPDGREVARDNLGMLILFSIFLHIGRFRQETEERLSYLEHVKLRDALRELKENEHMGRYSYKTRVPSYNSSTCQVWKAQDNVASEDVNVAIKVVEDPTYVKTELLARYANDAHKLDKQNVVDVNRVHVPEDEYEEFQEWCIANGVPPSLVDTTPSESTTTGLNCVTETYVLVMDWLDGSLTDAMVREHLAGTDAKEIAMAAKSIAEALVVMHEAGSIHGDIKGDNIMHAERHGPSLLPRLTRSRWQFRTSAEFRGVIKDQETSRRWQLIDLDACAEIGKEVSGKYSEAYIPPEYAKILLPTRIDGKPAKDQPTITACPSFDIWSFGLVLFELCAAVPLFMRDMSDDTLLFDYHKLPTWEKPTDQHLELVLRPAYQNGSASFVMQLVARDLILKCLQGCPHNRPTSMREVLGHQFFSSVDQIMLQRPLPHPDRGELDVIFSYRTIDAAEMMRLRQFLNVIGIKTADGSQVPPGEDWRLWYFDQMHKATVFVPILSRNYTSGPCVSETEQATQLGMPIVAVQLDSYGWNKVLSEPVGEIEIHGGEKKPYDTSSTNATLATAYKDITTVKLGDGGAYPSQTPSFFSDMVSVASEIIKVLPQHGNPVLYALILTAPEQGEFGKALSQKLKALGLPSAHISSMNDWTTACATAFSVLPVLSREFLMSETCFDVICATQPKMDIVPVTFSLANFTKVQRCSPKELAVHPGLNERIPYLNSLFNRANRIPPNADFIMDVHMGQLEHALWRHATAANQTEAKFSARVHKINSILGSLPLIPEIGTFETSNDMDTLCRNVLHLDSQVRSPRSRGSAAMVKQVIISHTGSQHGLEVAASIRSALETQGVETIHILQKLDDPMWFSICGQSEVCIALFSGKYVESETAEGQLTYAKDNGLTIVPVVLDGLFRQHFV